MKVKAQEIIDTLWSDWCDLERWIEDMSRKEQDIPKPVLKMSMKHLKDNIRKAYEFACEVKGEVESGEED